MVEKIMEKVIRDTGKENPRKKVFNSNFLKGKSLRYW
jgi:hypothetical protein